MTIAFIRTVGGRWHTPLITTIFATSVLCLAAPVSAQSSGPDTFTETESALTGTYACNGGATTSISPVDASTTDGSGGNQNNASNLSASACGLPLYSIGTASDATDATDTATSDDDDGSSNTQHVSLVGGVVTYDTKTETDACTVTDSAGDVACSNTTTINNLRFAGKLLTGTFTQAATFQAVDLQVQVPGACTGIALFSGTLTVASGLTQGQGTNHITQTETPVGLQGTLTCVGLPLTSMTVNMADQSETEILSSIENAVLGDKALRALRLQDL